MSFQYDSNLTPKKEVEGGEYRSSCTKHSPILTHPNSQLGLTNFSYHFTKVLTSKKALSNFNTHAHTKKHSKHSLRAKIKCSLVITINRKGGGFPESELERTRKTTSNENIINKITCPTVNWEESGSGSQPALRTHLEEAHTSKETGQYPMHGGNPGLNQKKEMLTEVPLHSTNTKFPKSPLKNTA